MSVIRVVIVDDHSVVRHGVERLLSNMDDLQVVATASGGEEAVRLVAQHRPDVVLMDLEMPGGVDGVEATRRIVASGEATRVVVLTSFSDRDRILSALDAGAIGYLLKDGEAGELERAVRAAARGEFPLDPKAARALLERATAPDPTRSLSDREREVLGLVGQGLPNKEIARRLGITERTVKGHLTNVYRQIGVDDRTQAALWAQRHGLKG